jgi:hypothetical protein
MFARNNHFSLLQKFVATAVRSFMTLAPDVIDIKNIKASLLKFITHLACLTQGPVLKIFLQSYLFGNPFRPGLILVGKAWSLPLEWNLVRVPLV